MIVAVTGATGFLGRHVVRAAVARGHVVRALVRPSALAAWQAPAGVHRVDGDLGDQRAVRELATGADVLLHLAARGVQSRDRDWEGSVAVNTVQTWRLVSNARDAGVARAVVVGTCLEYAGHGVLPDAPWHGTHTPLCSEEASVETPSVYGATKAAGGLLARAWARDVGMPLWYLRLASLYGVGDDGAKFLPGAITAAHKDVRFAMTPGAQVREWLHVDDASRAVLDAAERDPAGVVLANVGTGEGVTLRALVERVAVLAGVPATMNFVDASRPYRAGEVHHLVMDVMVAGQRLGFAPRVSLDDGLRAMVRAA